MENKNGFIMIDFERLSRTIMTRGLELSIEQMEGFGILRIFNSTGLLDDPDSARYFFDLDNDLVDRRLALLERRIRGDVGKEQLITMSVITFRDIVGMNKFCIYSGDLYRDDIVYVALSN